MSIRSQKIFTSLLNDSFLLTRTIVKKNSKNVITGTEEVLYGPYPCRIGRGSGLTLTVDGHNEYDKQRVLYCLKPLGITLEEGDLITIGEDKKPYIISHPYEVSKHHLRIDIRVKGDV